MARTLVCLPNSMLLRWFAGMLLLVAISCNPALVYAEQPAITSDEASRSLSWHSAPHIRVAIAAENEQVRAGEKFSVALVLDPEPGWHVYWQYAGDSGAAPILKWEADGAALVSKERYPYPERIRVGPLVNFGFSKTTTLIAEFETDSSKLPGSLVSVALDAEWLVCQDECIPGNAELFLTLPVATHATPSSKSPILDLFRRARDNWPLDPESYAVKLAESKDSLTFSFDRPSWWTNSGKPFVVFFPASPGIVSNSGEQQVGLEDGSVVLRVPRSSTPLSNTALQGILVSDQSWMQNSKRFSLAVAPSTDSGVFKELRVGSEHEVDSIWTAFLLAFLGGLILNLMPCVFPVLSIKMLGFVEAAHGSARRLRLSGLMFTLGVLCSFWALTGVILALQAGGERLGWGFQLQSPGFVAFLALVIFTVALNLLGLFEVGSSLQRIGDNRPLNSVVAESFWSGVLTTIVATPCTAPFMGPAIAFALSLSGLGALAVLTMLALGVATPYLALSFAPRLLSLLPKPGHWMVTFKQFMAFPMLATYLWLVWVLSLQAVSEVLIVQLLGALGIAFGTWILATWGAPTRTRLARILARLLCLGLVLTSFGIAIFSASASSDSTAVGRRAGTSGDLSWEVFSEELLQKYRGENRPVYVDFTAAWCITCQVNKKLVFSSDEVRREFKEKNIALLRADWTNKDPMIGATLEKYGRRGVPLNLLYSSNPSQNPHIFPTVLTPAIVLDQLRQIP